MSARVVVSCDGYWDDGRMPCRGAYPAASDHRPTAIGQAWRHGWEYVPGVSDLCPAHARIHSEAHRLGTA